MNCVNLSTILSALGNFPSDRIRSRVAFSSAYAEMLDYILLKLRTDSDWFGEMQVSEVSHLVPRSFEFCGLSNESNAPIPYACRLLRIYCTAL